MKHLLYLWVFVVLISTPTPAQTLAEAQELYAKNEFGAAADVIKKALVKDPNNLRNWRFLGITAQLGKDYALALSAYKNVEHVASYRADVFYNKACIYVALDQPEKAIDHLHKAYEAGYNDRSHVEKDPDLANIRSRPDFPFPIEYPIQTLSLSDGTVYRYRVALPAQFKPGSHMVLLGLAAGVQDERATGWAMPKFWGLQATNREWVAISPLAPEGGWYTAKAVSQLGEFLEQLKERYQPKGGLFHLAGLANGGILGFHMVTHQPHSFASLTVFPGVPRDESARKNLHKLRHIPVSLFVGDRDAQWWRVKVADTAGELTRLGGKVQHIVLEGEGHILMSLSTYHLMEHLQTLAP